MFVSKVSRVSNIFLTFHRFPARSDNFSRFPRHSSFDFFFSARRSLSSRFLFFSFSPLPFLLGFRRIFLGSHIFYHVSLVILGIRTLFLPDYLFLVEFFHQILRYLLLLPLFFNRISRVSLSFPFQLFRSRVTKNIFHIFFFLLFFLSKNQFAFAVSQIPFERSSIKLLHQLRNYRIKDRVKLKENLLLKRKGRKFSFF